jgi:hypothetical protein
LEQDNRTVEKQNTLQVPDAVYQRLVRMLISSASKEDKQVKRAKEINASRGA